MPENREAARSSRADNDPDGVTVFDYFPIRI